MSTEMSTACQFSDTPLSKIFSTNFRLNRTTSGSVWSMPFFPYGFWPSWRSYSSKTPELRGKCIVRYTFLGRNLFFSGLTFWVIKYIRKLLMTLLTIDDTTAYLNMSKSTVMRLIKTQAFDVIRVGRAVRIRQDALDRFLDAQTTYAETRGVAS